MQNGILIHEHRSPVWRYLAIGLFIVTIAFTGVWFFAEDVLWSGMFRFGAFACFASLVLVWLRIRQAPLALRVKANDDHLFIHYFLDGEEKKEELFERNTIRRIERKAEALFWSSNENANACKFIISFTDTTNTLSVFIYSGREISLSEKDAQKFETFLSDHAIPFSAV